MLSLGGLTFGAPWLLAGLLVLPFLVPLLRALPPPARRLRFAAARLLFGLPERGRTARRTPWWLVALRLTALASVLVAAAAPRLDPAPMAAAAGPLVLVVDDGWAGAGDWAARRALMGNLLDRAEQAGQVAVLVTTAPERPGGPVPPPRLGGGAEVRAWAAALAPKPWPVDRSAAARRLTDWLAERMPARGRVAWLSDGLSDGGGADLARALERLGPPTLHMDAMAPWRLGAPRATDAGLSITAARPRGDRPARGDIRLVDAAGRRLDRAEVVFADGETETEIHVDLPSELRRRVARVEFGPPHRTAGGVRLLDAARRRPAVGLARFESTLSDAPVFDPLTYLAGALAPSAEVRIDSLEDLMRRPLAMLVLADPPPLGEAALRDLDTWMDAGGVLLRFAGPRLADRPGPPLPVALGTGERSLGGSLSWTRPLTLGGLEGPLAGLDPPGDVTVTRQVLARPDGLGDAAVWARLTDGTPLITAQRRGEGWLILAHTAAGPGWSDLPLSAFYPTLLARLARLGAAAADDGRPRDAARHLDAFGRLIPPPPDAPALNGRFGRDVPPGLYGPPGDRVAIDPPLADDPPMPLDPPAGLTRAGYAAAPGGDPAPWLWALALLLLTADLLVSAARRGRTAAVLAILLSTTSGAAIADPLEFANRPRLAHMPSGDPAVDAVARAGLDGLGFVLARRSAVTLGPPVMADPATDDLSLFPLLYWPLTDATPPLGAAAARNLDSYMARGGLILIDGRGGLSRDADRRLRAVAGALPLPRLTAVPPDHVLGRSFYLLDRFPGRRDGGGPWVEVVDGRRNDGVAALIVGDNDWAAAWAMDETLRPIYPVAPGGEPQREIAFRFGVNLAMVALTGNYKTDQVHLDALLQRLGR